MTKIPYIDKLYSPVTGCSGKGCATKETCWARAWVKRFPHLHTKTLFRRDYDQSTAYEESWFFEQPQFHPDRLDQPLHWKKPRRIGVCFMGDWMDDQVESAWIYQILEVIAACPQHQFFTLTKQPQNLTVSEWWLGDRHYQGVLPNLWNGVSCLTQADIDRMVPALLRISGKKWISAEPMMGPMDFSDGPLNPYSLSDLSQINLMVLGCHSNPRRYPCKIEWIESAVEQCKAAGVKIFIKQLTLGNKCCRDISQFPKHLQIREI